MTFVIGTPHVHNCGHLDSHTGGHNSKHVQRDVQCCTHCQKVIFLDEWKDDGAWCGRCQAPICGPCGDRMATHGCEPYIAQIEKAFALENKLAQFRKLAGLDAPPPQSVVIASTIPRR